jgi:hypothetical protein
MGWRWQCARSNQELPSCNGNSQYATLPPLPAFILTMGQSSLRVTERRQPVHAALVVFSPFLSDRRSTAFATEEMKDEWDEAIGRVCPFIAHLRTSNVFGLGLTVFCSCVRSAFP